MNAFDVLLGKKLAGGSGGGSSGIENLLTSDIEVGTIDATGENADNANRLRTKTFTALDAGNYTLFFTSESSLNLGVLGFRYAADGTFIERFGGSGSGAFFGSPPLAFTAEAGQKFRFAFNSGTGTVALSPSDLHNLILVEN